MTSKSSSDQERRRSVAKVLRTVAVVLAVAALVKELRTPAEERTWHGMLAGFIPYDFRMPTLDRIKATMWDPDGSIIVGRVFGVGWTVNVGAVVTRGRAALSA